MLPHRYVSICARRLLEAVPANLKDAFNHGLEKRRKDRVDNENDGKRGKGEERCMYRLYAVVVHIGNMVHYSLEAITFRTLRSLLNHPVGRQRIHRDGQSLILWRTVRLRNRHKASWATNGKAVGVY